jgi:hypothetical protein
VITHHDSGLDHVTTCGRTKAVVRCSSSHEHVTCPACWEIIWREVGEPCDAASIANLQAEVRARLSPRNSWARLMNRREEIQ